MLLVFEFSILYTALQTFAGNIVIELPQMIRNATFMVALPVF
jgi:hypothetical protein